MLAKEKWAYKKMIEVKSGLIQLHNYNTSILITKKSLIVCPL